MIRLAIRLLPYGLVVFGAFMILGGVATLVGDVETAPTEVSIEQLEKGEVPNAEWWKIADGWLCGIGAVYEVSESKDGDEVGQRRHYVPVLSGATAQRWTEAFQADEAVPYERCALLVVLSEEQLKQAYPELAAGTSDKLTTPFATTGLRQWADTLPEKMKKALMEDGANFSLGRLAVIEHGSKPLQKGEAAGMLAVAALFIAGGVLWVRQRRRAAGTLVEAGAQALPQGVRDGVHAAVRRAVSGAMDAAGQERQEQQRRQDADETPG